MNEKEVTITKVQRGLAETLKEPLRNSGLRRKRKIFIKPNMSAPEYIPGAITTPALLYELVRLLRDEVEEVIVGESDGYNYPCQLAFEKTGIRKAVEKAGGIVVNLSEDKVVEVKFRGGPLKKLYLPKTVLEADAIVDVPLMKTHELMMYSGAIKNLFGCLPDNRRIFLHPYLAEVFFRLFSILKPDLTVMDGLVAMEGNGPTKGKPVKMDLVLTSNCALSTDIVASRIMGLDWKKIEYLNYIAKKTDLREDSIKVSGCRVSEVARNFELPRIDLPVKAQMQIYNNAFLTKTFFCSLDVVKLFQTATVAYRKTQKK